MRKQLMAGAVAVALATTTSSMAFAVGSGGAGGGDGSGFDGFRGGAIRGGYAAMHDGEFAGHSWHGGRRFAGRGYCSPYYDRHGYCGSSHTISW